MKKEETGSPERGKVELREPCEGEKDDDDDGAVIVDVSPKHTQSNNSSDDEADETDGITEKQAVKAPLTPAPQGSRWPLPFKPDSGFSCVDALRAIAVIGMVIKNVVQRATYGANPVARALGSDWVAPLFVFAAGCRLAAEQHHLDDALRGVSRRRARRLKAEAALKQYVRLIMIFVTACAYLIVVFGPLRVCTWDILVTIALSIGTLYPLHRMLPPWALLLFPLPILALSPVLFDSVNGAARYSLGYFVTNWDAGALAGSLFVWGPTPYLPYVAFAFLGDAVAQLLLSSPTATYQRRAVLGFSGLIVALVGLELHLIGERRGPFTSGPLSYVFPQFAMVPLTLSWSLMLSGAYVVSTCTLATILDPIRT
jgi:hypothetical protein